MKRMKRMISTVQARGRTVNLSSSRYFWGSDLEFQTVVNCFSELTKNPDYIDHMLPDYTYERIGEFYA